MVKKITGITITEGSNLLIQNHYKVGQDDVQKIEVYQESGHMAAINYLRVHFKCGATLEVVKSACIVSYGEGDE